MRRSDWTDPSGGPTTVGPQTGEAQSKLQRPLNERRNHLQRGAGSRSRDDPPRCRVMHHHRQPAAGMAPILEAAPHDAEACAAILFG
jgi:hypothetical protein